MRQMSVDLRWTTSPVRHRTVFDPSQPFIDSVIEWPNLGSNVPRWATVGPMALSLDDEYRMNSR
jgi:hypothetical protein